MESDNRHGFQSKEEWADFYEEYCGITDSASQDHIQVPREGISAHAWIQDYEERSARIRTIYKQVESMLERDIRYFYQELPLKASSQDLELRDLCVRDKSRWDETTAGAMLSYLFRNCLLHGDTETCFCVADSLERYYAGKKDEISLMKCYMIKISGYSNLDMVNWADEINSLCEKGAAIYERYFDELNDEERSMGISIYDFWLDELTEMVYSSEEMQKDLGARYFLVYAKSMEMIDRVIPTVDLNMKPNDSLPLIRTLYKVRLSSLSFRCSVDNFTPQQKDLVYNAAKELYETGFGQDVQEIGSVAVSEITYLMAQRMMGKAKEETIGKRICELLRSFPVKDVKKGVSYSVLLGADQAGLIAMEQLCRSHPDRNSSLNEVLKLAIHRVITIPNSAFNEYIVCNAVYRYICPCLKYLENRGEIIQALLGITVFRQVQTAFHTLMVGKLAVLIMEYLIEDKPELLTGQLGAQNCREVQRQKDKFTEFIYIGALLHDVGKLFCSATINTQYRKITDIEFQTIQFHPGTGAKLLSMIPQLTQFSDIVEGHHKSFDGKSGYPAGFDNTKSPIKIFIDLITICDSLDAATDTLGRNYATPKSFGQVLEELNSGAGKRYSDELVSFISGSDALKKELTEMIESGRGNVYFEVARLIGRMFEDTQ